MEAPRIVLAGAWISLMLIYLLGDVLRIVAGHYGPADRRGALRTGGH
jgi:hypothetical protein